MAQSSRGVLVAKGLFFGVVLGGGLGLMLGCFLGSQAELGYGATFFFFYLVGGIVGGAGLGLIVGLAKAWDAGQESRRDEGNYLSNELRDPGRECKY